MDRAPAVVAPDGCIPIEPFPGPPQSFVSASPEGDRLRVVYFQRTVDHAVLARAWFGRGAEGPPGYAHGGAVAAVLDEAMGAAAWVAGHASIAAHISVDFRVMVPLGLDGLIETSVAGVEGRKVRTTARLLDEQGRTLAESEGLFVTLLPEQLSDIVTRRGTA